MVIVNFWSGSWLLFLRTELFHDFLPFIQPLLNPDSVYKVSVYREMMSVGMAE